MSRTRILLISAMFLSAFFAPWWLGACLGVLLALRYRAWEVVLFGALVDVLWLPTNVAYGIPLATLTAVALVWALEPLRRQFLFDYV